MILSYAAPQVLTGQISVSKRNDYIFTFGAKLFVEAQNEIDVFPKSHLPVN